MPLRRQCLARLASNQDMRCEILVVEGASHTSDHTAVDKDGLRCRWREQVAVYPTVEGVFLTKDGLNADQAQADPTRAMPPLVISAGLVAPVEYETTQHLAGARDRQVGGDHYRKHKIQHWDIVVEYGLNYFEGAIVKYVLRHRDKNGVEDLKKARHTLDRLIELEEGRGQGAGDHGSPQP